MTKTKKNWKRIEAGRYLHLETGIRITRRPPTVLRGRRVGVRWAIEVPMDDGWHSLGFLVWPGAAATLRDAIEWAETGEDSFVERRRAALAIAWDEAHAEDRARQKATVADRVGFKVGDRIVTAHFGVICSCRVLAVDALKADLLVEWRGASFWIATDDVIEKRPSS